MQEQGGGCTVVAYDTITIQAAPAVNFGLPAGIVCSFDSIMLSDSSQAAAGLTIVDYSWNIGGVTYSGQNPMVVFNTSGSNTVTLTVTDNKGCNASITKNVMVTQGAAVDFDVTGVCEGDTTYFTNLTNFAGIGVSSTVWNLGARVSGNLTTTSNPSILYPAADTYDVTLRVQNDSGCISEITKPVTIYDIAFSCYRYICYRMRKPALYL